MIKLRLGVPQPVNSRRRLAAFRSELGPEQLASLLAQATGDTELTQALTPLLDQLDAAKPRAAETLAREGKWHPRGSP